MQDSRLKTQGTSLKSNLGLRSQILISLTILTVSALLLIGILATKLIEMSIMKQKVEQARLLSPLIAIYLSQGMDTGGLERVIIPFMKEMGVDEFTVANKERKVLTHGGGVMNGGSLYDADLKRAIDLGEERIRTLNNSLFSIGDTLYYSGPLKVRGLVYGGIKMVLPIGDVKKDLVYARRLIFIYAFTYAFILIIFGFFLLKRQVMTPIKRLEEAARRIAEGNLKETIKVDRADEIGSLTESFNKMTQTLIEKIEALEVANREIIETHNQMLRVERMASLGRLASSVAHEIGNPLGAISGYIDILLGGVDDEKEEKDILERIQGEIKRVKTIIRRTLDLSRPFPIELRDVDVNEVICSVIELLRGSLKGIDVNLNLNRELSLVKADPAQLEQVLINLILNAQDSMPNGGKLYIATEEEEKEDKSSIFFERKVADPHYLDFMKNVRIPRLSGRKGFHRWIKIVITDTGCGMDEATLNHIFAPFFSTKEPGKGTGLGLFISLGVIQSFGGDIRVRSEIGKGSTFEVILPAVKPL